VAGGTRFGPGRTDNLAKKSRYAALNDVVYGHSWHACPASRNPHMATLPANPCIEWSFLDANSCAQIYDTFQM